MNNTYLCTLISAVTQHTILQLKIHAEPHMHVTHYIRK